MRCEIYLATRLPTVRSIRFLRQYLCTEDYNFTEMLIISPPAATPLALQANHNSVTGYVYFYLFY